MIIRNLFAISIGFIAINLIFVTTSSLIIFVFPDVFEETNNVSPYKTNFVIGLNLFFLLLGSFTAGYITSAFTAQETVEWTFPTVTLTVIISIFEMVKLLNYLIFGYPSGIPYWYQFTRVLLVMMIIPIGGYYSRSR